MCVNQNFSFWDSVVAASALDCDADYLIYEVETKRINEAVRNNPDKFPYGYIVELSKNEWDLLKSKISTSIRRKPESRSGRV